MARTCPDPDYPTYSYSYLPGTSTPLPTLKGTLFHVHLPYSILPWFPSRRLGVVIGGGAGSLLGVSLQSLHQSFGPPSHNFRFPNSGSLPSHNFHSPHYDPFPDGRNHWKNSTEVTSPSPNSSLILVFFKSVLY